ncbi:VOC family protein [Kitasatospora cinereorecta]|uniref:VOC family protein n=1 Tax=Kitasatospora cinereorecta TaxID=285560 RepID=A0ABW0VED4_9ACTN
MHWSHVALNCGDLPRTEAFYTRWFGFHRARTVPVGDGEIVFLRNGDAYLELFPAGAEPAAGSSGPDGPPEPGAVRHLAFRTESVDELLTLMDTEAHVTLGPLDFDEVIPGWRTVWLRDPDGIVVEVSQGYRDQDVIEISGMEPTRV